MRKHSPITLQGGLNLSDPLAGFDGGRTGHGANNGLTAGGFAVDLGVHEGDTVEAGGSLPNSVRLDAATGLPKRWRRQVEANLRELGYGN